MPTKVPPQLPVYHCHEAPVPKLPPVTERVVAPPQVGFTDAVAPIGAVELVFTVTVTLAQAVLLQVPSART